MKFCGCDVLRSLVLVVIGVVLIFPQLADMLPFKFDWKVLLGVYLVYLGVRSFVVRICCFKASDCCPLPR
jgi:hypothetical protein